MQVALVMANSLQPYGSSSVHGILWARVLEWVAMPSSRGFPNPGIKTVSLMSPALAGRFLSLAPDLKTHFTKEDI